MIRRRPDYNLSNRNTFRMKVRCALFVEITEEADLEKLDWDALPQPVFVMGGGSNLLFTKDFPGTVLHVAIQACFGRGPFLSGGPLPVNVPSTGLQGVFGGRGSAHEMGPLPEVTVGAGVVFDDFCAWAAAEGLWGPENLSLIPGEVGASAVQNIGAYGVEAKDIITGIRAWDRAERRFVDIHPADCEYGYRTSRFKTEWKGRYIITAVTYRLSREPKPVLDYGGVRKALEARGVAVGSPEDSARFARSGPSHLPDCPPSEQSVTGPLPLPMCGGAHASGEPAAAPLTPQDIRDTIIGIRREKLPDPEEVGSAGSFFCNPVISREHFQRIVAIAQEDNGPEYRVPHFEVGENIKVPAAWMIDQCGFKGVRNGGAQVFPNQPLVIVNATGSATPEEVIGLEQQIIGTLAEKYGITLHPEVEHV